MAIYYTISAGPSPGPADLVLPSLSLSRSHILRLSLFFRHFNGTTGSPSIIATFVCYMKCLLRWRGTDRPPWPPPPPLPSFQRENYILHSPRLLVRKRERANRAAMESSEGDVCERGKRISVRLALPSLRFSSASVFLPSFVLSLPLSLSASSSGSAGRRNVNHLHP